MSNVLEINQLGKRYSIESFTWRPLKQTTLVDSLSNLWQRRQKKKTKDFWALKDVSFTLKHGEVLGIVGRNGAGKSTLLKILSRIIIPTTGEAKIYGQVGSLLEVGTGFHPELSGLENIYLNGAILGMKRHEIEERLEAIIYFSEVEKFLNTPVKFYSSGMYTRLAFSVAAHLKADILLVDEVLAVGDLMFRRKCLEKMRQVTQEGNAAIFVSHQIGSIRQLCTRLIYLKEGELVMDGNVDEVLETYLADNTTDEKSKWQFSAKEDPEIPMQILSACIQREIPGSLDIFEPVVLEIEYLVREKIAAASITCEFRQQGELLCITADTDETPGLYETREPGKYVARLEIPSYFKPASYTIDIEVHKNNYQTLQKCRQALSFEVEVASSSSNNLTYLDKNAGKIALPVKWNVVDKE